jgi:hypothetical protein
MRFAALEKISESNLRIAFAVFACGIANSVTTGTAVGQNKEPLRAPVVNAEDRLGGASIFGEEERLPIVAVGQLTLPPIMAATTDVAAIGNGSTPKEFRAESEAPLSDLPESGTDRDPQWLATQYQFAAANTFSHPRYFEDRMLERHGHERYPHLQPLVSGGRFFATFPMLPYLMTVRPPCECESQMGYFRPGTAVHPYIQRPPYQRNAVIAEAAAIAGASIALP